MMVNCVNLCSAFPFIIDTQSASQNSGSPLVGQDPGVGGNHFQWVATLTLKKFFQYLSTEKHENTTGVSSNGWCGVVLIIFSIA